MRSRVRGSPFLFQAKILRLCPCLRQLAAPTFSDEIQRSGMTSAASTLPGKQLLGCQIICSRGRESSPLVGREQIMQFRYIPGQVRQSSFRCSRLRLGGDQLSARLGAGQLLRRCRRHGCQCGAGATILSIEILLGVPLLQNGRTQQLRPALSSSFQRCLITCRAHSTLEMLKLIDRLPAHTIQFVYLVLDLRRCPDPGWRIFCSSAETLCLPQLFGASDPVQAGSSSGENGHGLLSGMLASPGDGAVQIQAHLDAASPGCLEMIDKPLVHHESAILAARRQDNLEDPPAIHL
jgi:hypothetical protein